MTLLMNLTTAFASKSRDWVYTSKGGRADSSEESMYVEWDP